MSIYEIAYHCPNGMNLAIKVLADSPFSARLQAIHKARRFLSIPKGQPSQLKYINSTLLIKQLPTGLAR
jgi:hypothetical protein